MATACPSGETGVVGRAGGDGRSAVCRCLRATGLCLLTGRRGSPTLCARRHSYKPTHPQPPWGVKPSVLSKHLQSQAHVCTNNVDLTGCNQNAKSASPEWSTMDGGGP